MLLLKAPVTP